jgi:hypothetical protein
LVFRKETVGIDYNWSEASFGEFKFNANKRNNYQDKYICNSSGFSVNPSYPFDWIGA